MTDDLFSVPGLKGAAVKSGVKPSGDLDLALIVAEEPMAAAGMFTTSSVAAAPVLLAREALTRDPRARVIVINSGNANALTGPRGMRDAEAMAATAEELCGGPAVVLSTGIIGVPLPAEKVLGGIREAAGLLEDGTERSVARAILTTDTTEKTTAVQGDGFVVGGIAKGSGMIHPNMATMLAVLATDAPIVPDLLRPMLKRVVDASFHEISVDGDTSTNDAVLLLSRMPPEGAPASCDPAAVERAVTQAARTLAEKIVGDGEGRSRIMEILIEGATSPDEARSVARAIACSSLVKTALAGGDPNWGRIISAAGTAGVPLTPDRLTLQLGDQVVFDRGSPVRLDSVHEAALDRHFSGERVRVRLDLARGEHGGRMLTTDLTHRYVEINSEYTT